MVDYSNIELSYVTPVYIENEETDVVQKVIENYESYSPELLKKIHFIFVDDCSPVEVNIQSRKLNFTLVRITDDITWNQGGARNLGVSLTKSSKLVLTDLDHIFPESLLEKFINTKTPKHFYRIRREQNGKKIHSNPNIFFCSKSLFYKSLGVDEEFCGHYGYEDVYFAKLQKALGSRFKKIRRHRIQLLEHKTDKKISHHFLKRDTTRNKALLNKKLAYLKSPIPLKGHSRLHILFKWKLVTEYYL